nr:F-box/FBD/LRR-repeat protein At1g13570-like [Lolium perenne]XP_051180106.1 F-box/FBD/LRR-repeat protein At1g13570-like [Lolium perenne]
MDTLLSPVPFKSKMAAGFRRLGIDPDDANGLFRRATAAAIATLRPLAPIFAAANHFLNGCENFFTRFFFPSPPVDHASRLPDALLGNIVSRLPVKDAARTAALSRRWRPVWRSTPLVLADADLLPATSAVSSVLAAHPGPFRCVHLTSTRMAEFHGLLTSWLQILAAKGVQELLLVNGRWPHVLVLPSTFLRMATLTRLYLGLWKFPDTAAVPRASFFPNLLELGLCSVAMENKDLDFILDRSPVLETLCVQGDMFLLRLCLVSQSLRCVQIIGPFEEIFVVYAPHLERLIRSQGNKASYQKKNGTPDVSRTKVRIGHSPKLHLLGYLELAPGKHMIEVGSTIIKAGTRVSPRTMVPSLRILAMEVRFDIRNDAKMIPSVLRCFPNVETLHIKSGKTHQSTGKLNLKFWHESGGTIECITRLVFRDFRGGRSELAFLKYFFESALVLQEVVILLADGLTSMEEARSKVESLVSTRRASGAFSLLFNGSSDPQEDYIQSFKRGSDFSLRDPFANY